MLPAIAGFKFKGNSAGQQNWTAAKLPFRARDMDVPSQRENFNHPDKRHRDKHPYIEYFEDSANTSLLAKC